MEYNAIVLDHFENPRNVGQLDKRDLQVGSAKLGNADNGDVINLQIKVSQNAVISEVKFKAYGNPYLIAGGSYLTTLLKNQALTTAQQIKYTTIIEALALPQTKLHCALLLEDALLAVLSDYQHKREQHERSTTSSI